MQFVLEPDQLTIRLKGWEVLWALKRTLRMPRSAISDVVYTPDLPVMQDFWGYLRAPGTAVPRRFLAGTYWRRHRREFWYVRTHQEGLLTVQLRPGEARYAEVRISCHPQDAQRVIDWWQHGA